MGASNRGNAKVGVLVVLLAALGGGYYFVGPKASAEVEADYAAAEAEVKSLTEAVEVPKDYAGPYHLAIRYGTDTLARLVHESVSKRMENGPPTENMGTAIAEKVKISPLKVTKTHVEIPEGKKNRLRAMVNMAGTINVTLRKRGRRGAKPAGHSYAIAPKATVWAHMESGIHQGKPAIIITLERLESFTLNASNVNLPKAVKDKVSAQVTQKIAKQLTSPQSEQSRRVQYLPETLGKGAVNIQLLSAGLELIPGKDGEMFMGFMTNLSAEPQVTAEKRGAPLGEDSWGVTLGDNTLGVMVKAMAQQGKIPSRFDLTGNPAEDGPVTFDIKGMELKDDGFIMPSTIWNRAFPAFWQSFDIKGNLAIKDGKMTPTILGMTTGSEGGGNNWLGPIIQKKQESAPARTLGDGSKKVPPRMPLPMSGGKKALQLNIEHLNIMEDYLTVSGQSEVVDL